MALFNFQQLAVALIALYVARRLWWEATTGSQRRALKKQHGCLPHHDTPVKSYMFGLDIVLKNIRAYKEHRLMESWQQALIKNSTHTTFQQVLGQQIYLTDDPENIKTILATHADIWSIGKERIDSMSAFLGKGIFTTEGKGWKHSREMLRPCFERSQVADVSILDKHTTRLIKLVPKDGTTVDLQPIFQNLTLDVATEFLFGRSTNALDKTEDNKSCEDFIEAFEYCQNPNRNSGIALWDFICEYLPDRKFKQCCKTIRDFTDNIIDEEIALRSTKSSHPDRYVFLDELLSQTSDRVHIRSELLNILLAGRDTTASLLSNLVWELARQPKTLARLRSEIAEYVGDEVPTYQQLKDMRYLKAIINESQRMYPIVPSNSRQALQDAILPHGGGPDGTAPILVPKGALCQFHTYSMHRRPDIFGPDADTFVPERWLDNEHPSSPLRPGWGYLPFQGGPRICIGQQFALTEAMFVVVRLLQTFPVLEQRDPEVWREKLSITCTGLGGCKVGLKR